MPSIETVRRYSAFLYPNKTDQNQPGRINLYCDQKKLYLIFVDPRQPLPTNTYNTTEMIGVGYQPFDRYAEYLDLVRNEGPISVTFSPEATPPTFVVYCASETPSEGEA